MKMLRILTLTLIFFALNLSYISAQVTCADIELKVGSPADPSIIGDFNCNFSPALHKEDCFLLSFPVFFKYLGNANPASTSFNVNGLTIQGNVVGGTNIVIEAENTERCLSQNLEATADVTNNSFEVIANGGTNLLFTTQQTPSFWVFVEARPGEEVEIDITSVTMDLDGQGVCTLDETAGQIFDDNSAAKDGAGDCQLSDLDLEFNVIQNEPNVKRIWIEFGHSHSSNISTANFDLLVKITDIYDNLEVKALPTFGNFTLSNPPDPIQIGNEYFIYYSTSQGINANNGGLVGQIEILDPILENEYGEATIEFEWGRWKVSEQGIEECCQPTLGNSETVIFDGELPCNNVPSVNFEVVPDIPQPANVGCEGQAAFVVSVDHTAGLEFNILDLEIQFETAGDIKLDEAAILDDFNNSNNIGCPANNSGNINGCLEVDEASNKIRYQFFAFPAHSFNFDQNGFKVIFSGTDGCVNNAEFRVAKINGMDTATGMPFNCVPEWSNYEQDLCIEFQSIGYPVQGEIKKKALDGSEFGVEDVLVNISSSQCNYGTQTTCDDGVYFNTQCDDLQAVITPFKDGDDLCGVSTFDLVLIVRHVLGTDPLDTPYQIIAADANNSGGVTTFDMVTIRKLILLIDDEFTHNTSWRFVDKDYVFPDPTNPFVENFPESKTIDLECEEPADADFIAIKIGDANLSCQGCAEMEMIVSEDPVVLTIDKEVQGAEAIFKFKVEGFTDIVAYQMDLDYDSGALAYDRKQTADLTGVYEDYFGINTIGPGKIRTLWYDENGGAQSLANFDKIFNLVFDGIGNISSGTVTLYTNGGNRLTRPVYNNVAYDSQGRIHPIILKDNSAKQEIINIEAFPNPFSNTFQLNVEANAGDFAKVSIYDVAGKLVFEKRAIFMQEKILWR